MQKTPPFVLSRETLAVCSHRLAKITNKISRRLIAFLLIAALLLSTVLFSAPQYASAKSAPRDNVPITAPPEPFIIHSPASESVLLPAITNLFTSIAAFFKLPSRPEGLTAERTGADPATFTEDQAEFMLDPPPPAGFTSFDFDGDGKADVARSHSANSDFKIRNSNGGSYTTYTFTGLSGARHAAADYDGDSKTDPAFFSNGTWTIRKSSTGTTQTITGFGQSGDMPVSGQYVGSSAIDAALFRPSTGVWYVCSGTTCTNPTSISFGTSGDIPVPGDYDHDGVTDAAVFRPSTGDWHVNGTTSGYFAIHWGIATDVPVPADYNGDGITDIAVFRPASGTWYTLLSPGFGSYTSVNWGNWADQPLPADYDGDGKADLAVWRPTTGEWWLCHSADSGYDLFTLGEHGDFAIPSAYVKQVGGTATPDELAQARLSPLNATGGTDPYSQNFSWSSGLVSLPGRAGLDLSLGISYNSLVWTKAAGAMYFDPDWSNITPGFRFGLPTIEPVYFDGAKQKYAFMMVTPSGGRIEFRQTAVSNTYETADSGYAQLVVSNAGSDPNDQVDIQTIVVTSTDGTQMSYVWSNGAFRCTQIKDRNGNYISATYLSDGRLSTVTDTLGRVVNVNYDSTTGLLSSITQTWRDGNGGGSNTVTHNWATFTYADLGSSSDYPAIDTDFGSLAVVGPPDSIPIKVLQKITYSDNSFTRFLYNNYAQVRKVENYAPDQHKLNHVRLNDIESVSGMQTDCPRYSVTKSYAENFNGNSEVEVTNSRYTVSNYTLVTGTSITGTRIDTVLTGDPNDHYARRFYGSSGWQEGLPLATEDCVGTYSSSSCTDRKRWTWTSWTQDNTNLAYTLNPRVIETKVGDGTNTKRTTIDYWLETGTNVAIYGLVKSVGVWDAPGMSLLKQTYNQYNMTTDYVSRRIIGLPSLTELSGADPDGWHLQTKVTYAFDENGYSGTGQSISPTQHDNTNYGTGLSHRGNLTSTTRWDVTAETNSSLAVTSSVQYNTAGLPITQTDPRGRVVRIGYTDTWNDGVARSTYAYPTILTDPNSTTLGDIAHSSFVKYRFDTGANVEATSPAPAGNSYGKQTRRVYNDSTGRLERNSIYTNTSGTWSEYTYTRYSLPSPDNGVQVFQSSTITDTNNNGVGDSADEVTSETLLDGAGNVRMARVPHTFNTNGTTATWAATKTEYDILGRVTRQSVPTEVDSAWVAAGDDAARGFLWTYQKYDWKGRVIRKINTDGSDSPTLNDSDILISYEGCGCAGGQVTTIQGELVPRTDTTGTARRTQKIYEDILGRTYQTESYNWNGTTVYSTVANTFNGRDQVVQTRQFAGDIWSATYQDTTATFDGHGRLASSHRPEQRDTNNNLKYTAYSYNADDSIRTITDGRGAVTNYVYSNLGEVEEMSWSVPQGSQIGIPTTVEFEYDNLGNRTSMTDGLGSVVYEYDPLSRMRTETRQFTDSLPNAPLSNNRFKLEYTYSISGQLRSYKDPYGVEIDYTMDRKGRLDSVSGVLSSGTAQFVESPSYRAWGALKHAEYGDGSVADATYDNRLRPSTFEVENGSTDVISKNYSYLNDGRPSYIQDATNAIFDRSLRYDHMGRVIEGKSGAEARGETVTTDQDTQLPYRQSYQFDAFGNLTQRNNLHWGVTNWEGQTNNFSISWTNNRASGQGWSYDNDGRTASAAPGSEYEDAIYNARGSLISVTSNGWTRANMHYTGDGHEAKRKTYTFSLDPYPDGSWGDPFTTYYIRSSVLGGDVVTEVDSTGKKVNTNIYAGGAKIAWHNEWTYNNTVYQTVMFSFTDPTGMTTRSTMSSGVTLEGQGFIGEPIEADPFGGNVGTMTPYVSNPDPEPTPNEEFPAFEVGNYEWGAVDGQRVTYNVDGIYVLFPIGLTMMNNPNVQCPNNDCNPRRHVDDSGRVSVTSPFLARNDGSTGYMQLVGTSVTIDGETGPTEYSWGFVKTGDSETDLQIGGQETQPKKKRKVFDGENDNRDMAWGRAMRDARELLGNEYCSSYISGESFRDPKAELISANNAGQIRDSNEFKVGSENGIAYTEQRVDSTTKQVTGVGKTFLGQIFYNPYAIAAATGLRTAREARVYTILHELKHRVFGQHNGKRDEKSWRDNLLAKCLKYLNLYRP